MTRAKCLLTLSVALLLLAPAASGQTFSLDPISPTVLQGFGQPDDLFLGQSAAPPALIPPVLLLPGVGNNTDGLSFGRPLNEFTKRAPAAFSVPRGSFGLAGTASGVESSAGEEPSDVYRSIYTGTNTLLYDGDGVATAPNPAAPPLSVAEPATFLPQPIPPPTAVGDVDALDLRFSAGMQPPLLNLTIYFSIDAASAAFGGYGGGASATDIYVGTGLPPAGTYDSPFPAVGTLPFSPVGIQPYATEMQLGVIPPGFGPGGNDVDALVVFDNGDNIYQPGQDVIAFSLTPGSIYIGHADPITGVAISPGDILIDGSSAQAILGAPTPNFAAILHTAESLGLRTVRTHGVPADDDLNALDLPEPATLVLLTLGLGLAATRPR